LFASIITDITVTPNDWIAIEILVDTLWTTWMLFDRKRENCEINGILWETKQNLCSSS